MLKERGPARIDTEARTALWNAIQYAGSCLASQCTFYLSRLVNPQESLGTATLPPSLPNWRLVEALSLMMILVKAERVNCSTVLNLMGKTGPLGFKEEKEGKDLYLWAQPSIVSRESTLIGRPDLVITDSADAPSSVSIRRVVECKCSQRLGAHDLRAEFGKAIDLRVTSYLIWSFATPDPKIVEGARRLGLDLVALEIDGPRRAELIARPENLASHVGNTIEAVGRESRFDRAVTKIGEDIKQKILSR